MRTELVRLLIFKKLKDKFGNNIYIVMMVYWCLTQTPKNLMTKLEIKQVHPPT